MCPQRSCSTLRQQQQTPPLAFFYNDVYEMPLPDNHKFPMQKYRLVREKVQRLLHEQLCDFHVSPLVSIADLVLSPHRLLAFDHQVLLLVGDHP